MFISHAWLTTGFSLLFFFFLSFPSWIHYRFSVDLSVQQQDAGYNSFKALQPPLGMRKIAGIEKQFIQDTSDEDKAPSAQVIQRQNAVTATKYAKAMEIAQTPLKQMLMNSFMLYMSGSTLNVFSISIMSMAILSPLRGIFGLKSIFEPLEDGGKIDLSMPKVLFFILNGIWLGIGLYKMSWMKLLPTSADWIGSIVWKENLEISGIPA